MKVSILIVEGGKQIMLTPESHHEKEALAYIAPGDVLKAVVRNGTFVYDRDKHMGIQVGECRGGYFREFSDENSLMFVIKNIPKNCPQCGAGFYKDTFNCPRCAAEYSWNGLELEVKRMGVHRAPNVIHADNATIQEPNKDGDPAPGVEAGESGGPVHGSGEEPGPQKG